MTFALSKSKQSLQLNLLQEQRWQESCDNCSRVFKSGASGVGRCCRLGRHTTLRSVSIPALSNLQRLYLLSLLMPYLIFMWSQSFEIASWGHRYSYARAARPHLGYAVQEFFTRVGHNISKGVSPPASYYPYADIIACQT